MSYPSCHSQLVKEGDRESDFSQGTVATDLEAFARHAGRSTIKTEDVLLLTRRNEGLETIMKNKLDDIKRENERRAKEKSDQH